ncbi:MAG: hypothetical protein PVG39_10785 [Desulfobacteraceae bacterium]|jgi:hypothetical protein
MKKAYLKILIVCVTISLSLFSQASNIMAEEQEVKEKKTEEKISEENKTEELKTEEKKKDSLMERIDFGNSYILGQSIKSGAVYLLHRKKSDIKSMLETREDYRKEILEDFKVDEEP